MRAKYGDPISIFTNPISIKVSYSHTSTRMLKIMEKVEQYIVPAFSLGIPPFGWIIGPTRGDFYDPNLTIGEVALQDSWNGLVLRSLIPTACINDILTVSPCFSAGRIIHIWMEPSVHFSIKSVVNIFQPSHISLFLMWFVFGIRLFLLSTLY